MNGIHIGVCGNIGSGKTTVVKLLADHFGWEGFYESVGNNPFLQDFYHDMSRWSFATQMHFLRARFDQAWRIQHRQKTVIQDRIMEEDAAIFAQHLYRERLMNQHEFATYQAWYQLVESQIAPPQLILYLRTSVPTLIRNIKKRNRDYERGLTSDYLQKLQQLYESWMGNYRKAKVVVIDMDQADFVANPEDLQRLCAYLENIMHEMAPTNEKIGGS
jgi:deoxyadenosine/deoxycytidine kinase